MNIQKRLLIFCVVLLQFSSTISQSFKRTDLDRYTPLLRLYQRGVISIFGRNSESVVNLRLAKQKGMLQQEIPPEVPFPCNVTNFRSSKPPSSVHQVQPGDIDVIGALGDSLTAGFGLVATNIIQVLMENRGMSWSIGGQDTWRKYLTLPNILKEFNPNLIGYSLKDSYSTERTSQFNPAEGAAISSEISYMAKILIKRIKSDPRVNWKKDWKLITVMFGSNDFCLDICFQNNITQVLENHRRDAIEILRILRDNLPRTIINFAPPPNIDDMVNIKNQPETCTFVKRIECYCMFADQYQKNVRTYLDTVPLWQRIDKEIVDMPEFHLNDFTVLYQPFLLDTLIPRTSNGEHDLTYLSADCFHLSQKMNARAANSIWNNMMEREGQKTLGMHPLFQKFACPTREHPYIFTNQNS